MSALGRLATVQGRVQGREDITARRLSNAKAMQDFLKSKAEMGETVSAKDAMSHAALLTGGNSLLYGFDADLVTESMLDAQRRKAEEVQMQQALSGLDANEKTNNYLMRMIDLNQEYDDPLKMVEDTVSRNQQFESIIRKNQSLLPELRNRAIEEQRAKYLADPYFQAMASADTLDKDFPTIPKAVLNSLRPSVSHMERERNRSMTTRFIESIKKDNDWVVGLSDRDFNANIDSLIDITARSAGIERITPSLRSEVREALDMYRKRAKEEKAQQLARARVDLRMSLLRDPNFNTLSKEKHESAALNYVKSAYGDLFTAYGLQADDETVLDIIRGVMTVGGIEKNSASAATIQQKQMQEVEANITLAQQAMVTHPAVIASKNGKTKDEAVTNAGMAMSYLASMYLFDASDVAGLQSVIMQKAKKGVPPAQIAQEAVNEYSRATGAEILPSSMKQQYVTRMSNRNLDVTAIGNMPMQRIAASLMQVGNDNIRRWAELPTDKAIFKLEEYLLNTEKMLKQASDYNPNDPAYNAQIERIKDVMRSEISTRVQKMKEVVDREAEARKPLVDRIPK
jgi:hypothetical protein